MLCDESYDSDDPEAVKRHLHPEPQSGEFRDEWIKSGMIYEQWIANTFAGRCWKFRDLLAQDQMILDPDFESKLKELFNVYGVDNYVGIPDYILAHNVFRYIHCLRTMMDSNRFHETGTVERKHEQHTKN